MKMKMKMKLLFCDYFCAARNNVDVTNPSAYSNLLLDFLTS